MANHEEPTREQNDPRSFEERVFARFDGLDARFQVFESQMADAVARLERLEAKQYDTKPIWERALVEIAEVKGTVKKVESKVNAIAGDMYEIKGVVQNHEERLQQFS